MRGLAVLFLLITSACADDVERRVQEATGVTTTTTLDAAEDGGDDGGGGQDEGPSRGTIRPSSSTSRPREDRADAPPPSTETTREEDDGSSGPPGAFARTLLRPQPAASIAFERFVQDGADVAPSTLSRNAGVVGEVSGKPVDVRPPIALPGGPKAWTAAELRDVADRMSKTTQGNGRAVLRLVFVRGNFQGNDDVLGAAVRGDVLALFRDSIAAASTPLVSSRSLEDAVLLHEIGHLLGLVDIALATGRADPEHPGHSKNRESVMYWAVESSLVTQVLEGGPPRDFDSADLADLRALRNGA